MIHRRRVPGRFTVTDCSNGVVVNHNTYFGCKWILVRKDGGCGVGGFGLRSAAPLAQIKRVFLLLFLQKKKFLLNWAAARRLDMGCRFADGVGFCQEHDVILQLRDIAQHVAR